MDPKTTHYFTDGGGKEAYLTGSHTWNDLQDSSDSDHPECFDFKGYLGVSDKHHHDVICLWMTPRDDLASARSLSLADPGREYGAGHLPAGGQLTVDLSKTAGNFGTEWLQPGRARQSRGSRSAGVAPRHSTPRSSKGHAVLYREVAT